MWWEIPDSHHGILPPAVKKSAELWTRAFAHRPIATITKK